MVKQEIKHTSQFFEFLYSYIFIPLTYTVFFALSLFNQKARRGLRGRKRLFESLEKSLAKVPANNRVWFHASSLGEFEQAKPIIEILKASGFSIIVSFFSPSGYEYSKNYEGADVITYLPVDSPHSARRFVSMVKPKVAVVMRYDLWFNHLREARKAGTKIILADATFPVKVFQRANFLRNFYRTLYSLPHVILTTTPEHKKMFDFFLGTDVTTVTGDTRFDRVYNRSMTNNMAQTLPFSIDRSRKTVLILGSTWRQDLEVVADGVNRILNDFPQLTVIVVPHEPTVDEITRLRAEFPGAKVLSEIDGDGGGDFSSLIIDRVGILTQLYVLADVAYVGGGFGVGVHSVLEPAVYGIPIITGPRIERSDEAVQLLQTGGLFFIKDAAGAYDTLLKMIDDQAARKQAGKIAKQYVDRHLGASAAVAARVKEFCS
jgi:3-deoxy-D-manno-octulosonic-acid transferase